MKEIRGNLWDHLNQVDALCVTTNGFVKKNGQAVMGRGCALEAKNRWPVIAGILGRNIKAKGNVPHMLARESDTDVWSFPVKGSGMRVWEQVEVIRYAVPHMHHRLQAPCTIPGWALKADLQLIAKSARYMVDLGNKGYFDECIIPRPGCGAGGLSWRDVQPVLAEILDDRFSIITY